MNRRMLICQKIILLSVFFSQVFFLNCLQAEDKPVEGITIATDWLVIPPTGRYGRIPISIDPLYEDYTVTDDYVRKAGDLIESVTGKATAWASVTVSKNQLNHPALRGGYALVGVKSDKEQMVILEGTGFDMFSIHREPHMGDIYGHGYLRVPIKLKKGENPILLHALRGSMQFQLRSPKAVMEFNTRDITAPDLIVGEKFDTSLGIIVLNNSDQWLKSYQIFSQLEGYSEEKTEGSSIPPQSFRKVSVKLSGETPKSKGPLKLKLELSQGTNEKKVLDTFEMTINAKDSFEKHRCTFKSQIDDSTQYYAVVPPSQDSDPKQKPGLVLTLHGASVEANGQAGSYAAKKNLYIIAPTNRRPYGFDWEDWGRLDAMEVLDLCMAKYHIDPSRVYLTGHSMGGHGTWHVGVTFPDRFAAIGPSAGWVSFWSYAGMKKDSSEGNLPDLMNRARNNSDTLLLSPNYGMQGVYILHGDADDNVPVQQARTMRKMLSEFHRDFVYYEEPHAGHWWGKEGMSGAACVDWKPMFDFFEQHRIPEWKKISDVRFQTVNPGVSANCHWIQIALQEHYLQLSKIEIHQDLDKRSLKGTTENIARLLIKLTHFKPDLPLEVDLDGSKIKDIPWPKEAQLWLEKVGKEWKVINPPSSEQKNPSRYGLFKSAFNNHMIFVYGTTGTQAENQWSLAKARFDAEQFWYRGNGSVQLLSDEEYQHEGQFTAKVYAGRNAILYGNQDTNSACRYLLKKSPIQVSRGKIQAGNQQWTGEDISCLFIVPNGINSLFGVVSGTGLKGLSRTDRLPVFTSGSAYPDYVLFDSKNRKTEYSPVLGAGYFGKNWDIESGESSFKK